jgi:hypothetical protein
MTTFFFYKNLTNVNLIQKINNTFEIFDGYVLVHSYDENNNILNISDNPTENNTLLYGKIVYFKMTLNDVIKKIDNIDECKFKNKNTKYTLTTIWASKKYGGTNKAYIIY